MYKTLTDLINAMNDGVAEFDFYKQNGEIRHAKGTLNPYEIAKTIDSAPIHFVKDNVNPNYVNYFDLDRKQTRTFNCENLILDGVETTPVIKESHGGNSPKKR